MQTGGTVDPLDQPAILRAFAQFFKETIAEAQVSAKSDGFAAKDVSAFLLQAKSHGRICSPGGRCPSCIALSSDGTGEASTRSQKMFAASQQSPRTGKERVAFGLCV